MVGICVRSIMVVMKSVMLSMFGLSQRRTNINSTLIVLCISVLCIVF